MSNPLTDRTGVAAPRMMFAGDERLVTTRDGHAVTIIKTSRPFVYDLCDAYNDASRRPELEWYVDAAGNLKLGYRADWSRQNARLQQHRRETEGARALQRSFDPVHSE